MNHLRNKAFFNSNGSKNYLCFGEGLTCTFHDKLDFDKLEAFIQQHKGSFIYGYISYDAKNSIENTSSNNVDYINAPIAHFHVPTTVVELSDESIQFIQGADTNENRHYVHSLLMELNNPQKQSVNSFEWLTEKSTYLERVNQLKDHIQRGNIYEINYCQQLLSKENRLTNPMHLYAQINRVTKAPFSVYLQNDEIHVLCGSPERFICKQGKKVTSQPIKGTAPRGKDDQEDIEIKTALKNNPKEISENVMIVDLVRNDLSKIAQKGSVAVDELFGIYTFPTVHQMISTISCSVKEDVQFTDIIRATFPMGSMTGAPKLSATILSEQYEDFKRGIYSGTIGYILPNGDFDFNVVIRSMIYNESNGNLTCAVGGAITIQSDPESEYQECQTKIGKILSAICHD